MIQVLEKTMLNFPKLWEGIRYMNVSILSITASICTSYWLMKNATSLL